MRDRVRRWSDIRWREAPSRLDRGDQFGIELSNPSPVLLAWVANVAVDRVGGLARVRTLRWDRTLGISCNRIVAALTAAYLDPTCWLGLERLRRPDASHPMYRRSTVGPIMLSVEAILVGYSLLARRRAIRAGFPFQPAALLDCSIPSTTAKHVIILCPISTVNLCLIASGSRPGARTATRIQIQGGQD